jgi:hypothetical protein
MERRVGDFAVGGEEAEEVGSEFLQTYEATDFKGGQRSRWLAKNAGRAA